MVYGYDIHNAVQVFFTSGRTATFYEQLCDYCSLAVKYYPVYQMTKFLTYFINPFPNKPWFLCVCIKSILKTLQEKEKLLETSNFSLSTVFSTHLKNFLPFSSKLKLSSATSYSLEESKICCLRKG